MSTPRKASNGKGDDWRKDQSKVCPECSRFMPKCILCGKRGCQPCADEVGVIACACDENEPDIMNEGDW